MNWILRLIGGRMTIEERSPRGTRIVFTLSLATEEVPTESDEDDRTGKTAVTGESDQTGEPDQTPPSTSITTTTPSETTEGEETPTVLLIEDEEGLADLYEIWLSDTCTVKTAYDGESGLDMLDETIDVVFLDRRMPGLSGDMVLERIREQDIDVRVVLTSAVDPDVDLLELPFDDYLVKSADQPDIVDAVERMMARTALDEPTQELARLVSTKRCLEEHNSHDELQAHEKYHELLDRIDSLQSEAGDLPDEFDDTDLDFPTSGRGGEN